MRCKNNYRHRQENFDQGTDSDTQSHFLQILTSPRISVTYLILKMLGKVMFYYVSRKKTVKYWNFRGYAPAELSAGDASPSFDVHANKAANKL